MALSLLPLEEAIYLSNEKKLLWFKEVRIQHPRVMTVLRNFECMAKAGSGTDIIILIGPTGVGKSTLISYLWKLIMTRLQDEMQVDPGFIPAVVIDGPASGEKVFSWRMLYVRILGALQAPLIDRRLKDVSKEGRFFTQGSSHSSTVAALWSATAKELIARRTSLLAIDEAVSLLRNQRGDGLDNAMDALKSMANICGLTLALIGSYDLLKLANLSGQLARRCAILDFPRYHKGDQGDEEAFCNVIRTLQGRLPLQERPNLMKYAPRLMDEALGCVGILKDILSRALSLTLQAGGTWSDNHLNRALLPAAAKTAILREILQGENEMRNAAFGTGRFGQLSDIEKSLLEDLGARQ